MDFYVAILILKMKENKQHFWLMHYYFKKGKNTTEMQKKKKDLCSVWRRWQTDQICQKSFVNFHARYFSLDNAPWLGRRVEVDRGEIKTYWEQSTLYHEGDSQHTQNIQIIKVISENEKCVFYFMERINGLFGQPNICNCCLQLPASWYLYT